MMIKKLQPSNDMCNNTALGHVYTFAPLNGEPL